VDIRPRTRSIWAPARSSVRADELPRRPRLVPVLAEATLVVLFYGAVAVFATWPNAKDPLGGFYGFGNDNWGGIWIYGWLHDAYWGPASASYSSELQAPFGYSVPHEAIQPMDRLFALLFGGPDEGLGAHNLQIFLSFVLAGCTMYLLARYITQRPLAAGIAGFIYTFSPFHLAQAMQYPALSSIQWIPLFVLALLLIVRDAKLRYAVLAGAAYALIVATSYYHAWFVAWFTALLLAAFSCWLAWSRWRQGKLCRGDLRRFAGLTASRAAVAGAVAILLAGPAILSSARIVAEGEAVVHPLTEAVRYSARPWMLFIPPHDNPILGPHVRDFVQLHLYENPVNEQSIYLGYTVLVLAALAFIAIDRRRMLTERERLARGLLAVGSAIGLLILIGPYIPLDRDYWRLWAQPDLTTHVPSLGLLMFELGPFFRFFSRAYILVSVCIAPLAAVGFARIERSLGPALWPRLAAATIVLALVAIEYTNAPPHRWVSDETPAWVRAVRSLPADAAVVDYPVALVHSPRALYYLFWQREHRRATLNPPESPEATALAAAITSPDNPDAGKALRDAGFDYAIVHTRLPPQTFPPYQPALPDDSMPITAGSANPWFTEVQRTPDAVVYKVLDAVRPVAAVRAGRGFGDPEPEGHLTGRWLEAPVGALTLEVSGPKRRFEARIRLSSFTRSRRVLLTLGGRPLRSVVVSTTQRAFSVALGSLGPGRYTILLRPSPGGQSIQKTLGVPDPRVVSIRLHEPVTISG
jgi:hypothetical protein